jgi:hypothetical protein
MKIAVLAVVMLGCGGGNDAPDAAPDANPALRLSTSGLYADFASRTIAGGYLEYTPSYVLWADGLGKRRWIYLPPGQPIDTSDMNHWVFPVGTRVFKEFAEADGTPLEMRLFEKTAVDTWNYGAYVWRDDGSDGDWTTTGAHAVRGTTHDVPDVNQCFQCHAGEGDKILGFSALQLSNGTLTTISSKLSSPPAGEFPLPSSWGAAAPALGYLHANCGHCHNPLGTAGAVTSQLLRLSIADTQKSDVTTTAVYQAIVGVATDRWMVGAGYARIAPHDLAHSAIYQRMMSRTATVQMPPIATITADMDGYNTIATWIGTLP